MDKEYPAHLKTVFWIGAEDAGRGIMPNANPLSEGDDKAVSNAYLDGYEYAIQTC